MDSLAFLRRIWPSVGHYCVDTKLPVRGFRHHWFTSIELAAQNIRTLDASDTVYHACASFREPTNRKGENALAVRSLWMDLDVGDDPKKFSTLQVAAADLHTFLKKTLLPVPLIIASGGGLHCYWTFTQDIGRDDAHPVAVALKALAAHHKFKIDHSRTADFASVLRPVGTFNRKYNPAVEVKLVKDAAPNDFTAFATIVADAMGDVPAAPAKRERKKPGVNAVFEVPVNYPDSDPDKCADKCEQLRTFRDTQGNIPEPQWYAGLQVIHFCKGGDEKIHQWSSGFPDYSAQQTDAKIRQIEAFGPTTCATFEQRVPDICKRCPHRGTITSPIQLGAVYAELPAPPAAQPALGGTGIFDAGEEEDDPLAFTDPNFVAPPRPFSRTAQGVVFTGQDGVATIVYPYDLYLSDLAYDEAGRYEMSMVRHQLPQEGWLEFPFRSSSVSGDRDFEQAMRDNHIKPLSVPLLKLYLKMYMQEIQRAKKIRRLYASMGWKDGTAYFVWGTQAYYRDGTTQAVGVSPTIASVARALRAQGDRQAWVDATAILDAPNMEAHALAFSAGPGSILMKFTGFEGALFNAVGESNSGKTSIARFFTSMFGCFDEIKLRSNDTMNAKIARIGILSSLPVYVDEVTNEDPEEVSNFVYEITQGRSKLRLRTDGTERDPAFWSTIVVSSSNTSLSAKLGLAKANPEAERLRLFEFPIERQPAFDGEPARALFRACSENYGHAGPEFIRYVVTHQDEVKAGLEATMEMLRKKSGAREEERMWIASVACGLYGLALMKRLGLILFDPRRVALWALQQMARVRLELDEDRVNALQLLGLYFNESAGQRVTLRQNGHTRSGEPDWIVERQPTGSVYIRYEITTQRIWVDAAHLKRWLVERQGDVKGFERELLASGVMVRKFRKMLGAGTGIATAQVYCYEFNAAAPDMQDALHVMAVHDGKTAETNAALVTGGRA